MEEDVRYTLTINSANLEKVLKARREGFSKQIDEFNLKFSKNKVDKQGNVVNDTNPFLVSTYFFKPINPMGNVEPIYNSEQLASVYDLYCEMIEKINMEVMLFQPTISHFAKFAGISLNNFNELRNSVDENMRVLMERINSDIFDANMTLTQHKKLSEKPTTFRMKVENEMIEKKSPSVNVNVSAKSVDLDRINARIREIQNITRGRIKYEEKE